MRYRLIIFDWDGTLMDSEARIVDCMQAAARDTGLAELSRAAVRDIIGLGLPEAIDKLCPGISAARAETLRQHYAQRFRAADQTPLQFFPGVERGIARLREGRDTRLAVATGKSRRGLDRVFAANGSGAWFDASRTADETRSKPHPQMLEELLDETGVDVGDAVMVGDTEYDLDMARALGMDRIAVTYGVHEPRRLAACQPSFTAHAFPELIDWLHA
ncbi:HAD-IA family hydrolase [Franzmannia qiaohouensis]|uniref:HAD-IA family hydrolase n=1 Tax=Franzmannia qiaohouensis TaxID=1329370 RepID=A0ABU1HD83_9GAMM|nr:HAD-IA family hydrolase [Halomonas qiaohouensis]MDR5905439.1 HAD-IA family hydrolase [Halomonas qiaohouensis]